MSGGRTALAKHRTHMAERIANPRWRAWTRIKASRSASREPLLGYPFCRKRKLLTTRRPSG